MRIAELVESLDLPETEVAEGAWDAGRRRVRRLRGGLAAGAAALAVASVVGVVVLTGGHHRAATPDPAPATSTPTSAAPLLQPLLTGGRWRAPLLDMDSRRFDGRLDRAVPLSADPVGRAVLAMGDSRDEAKALVLGEDGQWRRVDVPGLVPVHDGAGYTSPIVRPTSLSPDATKLALPQPDALVVVDLTDGSSRRYPVPGPGNTYAIWADESHVLVAVETAAHGTMVDLRDGSVSPSTYGPSTRFLGDDTLTWTRSRNLLLHSVLQWGDGRNVHTRADNAGGLFPQPPLVRNDVVIGLGGVVSSRDPRLNLTIGFEVVDGSTGRLLAYLPLGDLKGTTALLLGWDGDRPVIGAPLLQKADGLFVFAWDWHQAKLDAIGHVGDWTSWGTGQLP